MSVEEITQAGKTPAEGEAGSGAATQTDSNVLSFSDGAMKRSIVELHQLLGVYDRLIALLRETDNDGLDMITDSMLLSVVRSREMLSGPHDEGGLSAMQKELRLHLHEFPRTLRSLLPGLGPRLSESLEHKLGIQFLQY